MLHADAARRCLRQSRPIETQQTWTPTFITLTLLHVHPTSHLLYRCDFGRFRPCGNRTPAAVQTHHWHSPPWKPVSVTSQRSHICLSSPAPLQQTDAGGGAGQPQALEELPAGCRDHRWVILDVNRVSEGRFRILPPPHELQGPTGSTRPCSPRQPQVTRRGQVIVRSGSETLGPVSRQLGGEVMRVSSRAAQTRFHVGPWTSDGVRNHRDRAEQPSEVRHHRKVCARGPRPAVTPTEDVTQQRPAMLRFQ